MSKYLRFFESDCSFSYPHIYSGPKRLLDSSSAQVAGYLDRLSETELLVTGMKIFMFQDAHWQIVFYLAMSVATHGIIKFPTSPLTLGNIIYWNICICYMYIFIYVYAPMYLWWNFHRWKWPSQHFKFEERERILAIMLPPTSQEKSFQHKMTILLSCCYSNKI